MRILACVLFRQSYLSIDFCVGFAMLPQVLRTNLESYMNGGSPRISNSIDPTIFNGADQEE